jgi:hypothetical protein
MFELGQHRGSNSIVENFHRFLWHEAVQLIVRAHFRPLARAGILG